MYAPRDSDDGFDKATRHEARVHSKPLKQRNIAEAALYTHGAHACDVRLHQQDSSPEPETRRLLMARDVALCVCQNRPI